MSRAKPTTTLNEQMKFRNKREQKIAKTKGRSNPRVLVFDIETQPMLSYHWSSYKQFISPVQVVEYGKLLCWAAKWLGEKAVLFDSTQHDEDDKRCCETLWELCDEADILVAHNGQAFDMGYMKARWLFHDFVPPSPVKIVDTLKIARKQFKFPDNKLETLVRYLGIGSKLSHHGFQLWIDCMEGKRKGWQTMEEYNLQDVLILEEFYLKIRPWDTRHPNVALLYDDEETRCVACGGRNMKRMSETAKTSVSLFEAQRCKNCGKVMRVGKRDKMTKEILRNAI